MLVSLEIQSVGQCATHRNALGNCRLDRVDTLVLTCSTTHSLMVCVSLLLQERINAFLRIHGLVEDRRQQATREDAVSFCTRRLCVCDEGDGLYAWWVVDDWLKTHSN